MNRMKVWFAAALMTVCLIGCGKSENIVKSVDYDLTEMNSDMVYATVYQLMMDPDKTKIQVPFIIIV